jgi:hypothetical protein
MFKFDLGRVFDSVLRELTALLTLAFCVKDVIDDALQQLLDSVKTTEISRAMKSWKTTRLHKQHLSQCQLQRLICSICVLRAQASIHEQSTPVMNCLDVRRCSTPANPLDPKTKEEFLLA